MTKVDILAVGSHPDDVELSASGTLLRHAAQGKTFGLLDLTRGELGTRGTPEIRAAEAARAAQLLGAAFRQTLDLPDGLFTPGAGILAENRAGDPRLPPGDRLVQCTRRPASRPWPGRKNDRRSLFLCRTGKDRDCG